MRIGAAARKLGTSPRMLRYREALGLLPNSRSGGASAGHRQYDADDLDAVQLGLELENRYDVPPAALAFALRVLTDAEVARDVHALAQRLGRLPDPQTRAAELDRERALRWLGRSGMLADRASRAAGASDDQVPDPTT